jgi:hypothetical protein
MPLKRFLVRSFAFVVLLIFALLMTTNYELNTVSADWNTDLTPPNSCAGVRAGSTANCTVPGTSSVSALSDPSGTLQIFVVIKCADNTSTGETGCRSIETVSVDNYGSFNCSSIPCSFNFLGNGSYGNTETIFVNYTVRDNSGNATTRRDSGNVTYPPQPTINCSFSSNPTSLNNLTPGQTVIFTDTSTMFNGGTINSWNWSTSAGNPVSGIGSSFTWTAPTTPGTYSAGIINLTIDDFNGAPGQGANPASCSNTNPITVINTTPPPPAPTSCSFSGPTTVCTGQTVQFDGRSSTNTTSWYWQTTPFGAGSPSSGFVSTFDWTAPSTPSFPTMNLAASGPSGADSCSSVITVQSCSAPPPTPTPVITCSFDSSVPLNGLTPGQTVTFTDTSTITNGGTITSRNWSTSAGNPVSGIGTAFNWTAPNTPGTYPGSTVQLLVSGSGASDQCQVGSNITVTNPTPPPPVGPPTCNILGPISLQSDTNGNYASTTTGTVTGWVWSASGGTFNSPPGIFGTSSNWKSTNINLHTLFLTVSGPNGSGQCSLDVNITPTPPAFDFSLAHGGDITVTRGSSGTNNIFVNLNAGNTQNVSLGQTGSLPTGVGWNLSTFNCSPNCTSVASITTTTSTPLGSHPITIQGVGGGLTRNTTFMLNVVTDPTPPPPVIPPSVTCGFNGPSGLQTNQSGTYTSTSSASGGAVINNWTWLANGGSFASPFASATGWSSAAAGTYTLTLTVQDTVRGLSQQCSASVSVSTGPPPFDFSLINGGNVSVVAGQQGQNPLTVSLVSGTPQLVTFNSPSGLPANTSFVYGLTGCTPQPSCNSTLYINTTSATPTGTYPVIVTATGGGITRSTSFNFIVTGVTPPPPTCPDGQPPRNFSSCSGTQCSAQFGCPSGILCVDDTQCVPPPPPPAPGAVSCTITGPTNLNVGQNAFFQSNTTGGVTSWVWTVTPLDGNTPNTGFSETLGSWGAFIANNYTIDLTVSNRSFSNQCQLGVSVTNPPPAVTPPPPINLPWIQTTGGDVHSNQNINTPAR